MPSFTYLIHVFQFVSLEVVYLMEFLLLDEIWPFYRLAHHLGLGNTFSTNNSSLLMSTHTTKWKIFSHFKLHHLLMKTVVIVYEKKICVNSIKTKSLFY